MVQHDTSFIQQFYFILLINFPTSCQIQYPDWYRINFFNMNLHPVKMIRILSNEDPQLQTIIKKTSWIVILLHTVHNNTACSQPVIIPSFSSSGRASSIIPKTLGSFKFFIIDLNYGCENSVISYHAEIIFIKIFA